MAHVAVLLFLLSQVILGSANTSPKGEFAHQGHVYDELPTERLPAPTAAPSVTPKGAGPPDVASIGFSPMSVAILGVAFPLLLLGGFVWGHFERRRRQSRKRSDLFVDNYRTKLFDCFSKVQVCMPACFFMPVLAAFNRAEVDNRDCRTCDVCSFLCATSSQYTTRQSIRSRFLMQEDPLDALSACCCTPCAVGQDAIELAQRTLLDQELCEEEDALCAEEEAYFRASSIALAQRRRVTYDHPEADAVPTIKVCLPQDQFGDAENQV